MCLPWDDDERSCELGTRNDDMRSIMMTMNEYDEYATHAACGGGWKPSHPRKKDELGSRAYLSVC